MTTSELLKLAATIADRMNRRGEECSPEDALDRARAALEQLAQLKALAAADWDDTVIEPPYDHALAEVSA